MASRADPEVTFQVGYAKSARAACRHCYAKIAKDSIRIGIQIDEGLYADVWTSWLHLHCFPQPEVMDRYRKYLSPDAAGQMMGFSSLNEEDRTAVAVVVRSALKGGRSRVDTNDCEKKKPKTRPRAPSPLPPLGRAQASSSAFSTLSHVTSNSCSDLGPRLRRPIALDRYCRQYLHRRGDDGCKFGSRCKFLHLDFCRAYAFGECGNSECEFLHVDVCPLWKDPSVHCSYRPCKYLHVTQSSMTLRGGGHVVPNQAVSWGSGQSASQVVGAHTRWKSGVLVPYEEEVCVPLEAETSQLTLGMVEQRGYLDFGDSEVDNDTGSCHSDDQSSGSEEPPIRPALKRPAAAARRPPRSCTEDAGKYKPPAPVLRRPASGYSSRQSARTEDFDTDVVHRWRVTCKRCKQEIMKVYNHRIVSEGRFLHRALRGFWLQDQRPGARFGKMFGRGSPGEDGTFRAHGKSCQLRLPCNWDVSRPADRRREKRILKGKLLKVQFKHHVDLECACAPDMDFAEKCRVEREVDWKAIRTDDGNDLDDGSDPVGLAPLLA